MSIFRRILGVLMIAVGIAGIIIAVGVAYYGRIAVDTVATGLNTTVGLLQNTIGTTVDTLDGVKTTLGEATATVNTVTDTVGNLSTTLFDTQPLLQQVSSIATQTVPNSLDAVQSAIPTLAGIADTIDTTLTRLDDLKVERVVLGVPINFDLGINYAPKTPFEEAVLQLGESFTGLPDQLRTMDQGLNTAVENISVIGNNIDDLAANLSNVSATLTAFPDLLDQYVTMLRETEATLVRTKEQFEANLNTIKWVITGLGVWFALYQVVPLYVGWRMVTEDDEDEAQPATMVVATVPEAVKPPHDEATSEGKE